MKNILRYIIAIILTILIIAFLLINLLSSTILSENYILLKLDETNYYNKMYQYVQSSFENYIYQSGLDENVLDNIVSKEKIKKDTKIIIGNIYDGLNEKIDTQEIKDNLNANINNSFKNQKMNTTQKEAIEQFVSEITNEYTKTMSHSNYEAQINSDYKKGMKYIGIAKKVMLISIAVLVILLILLSLRRTYRIFTTIGISTLASGTFFAITNLYIMSKIKIQTITILNDAISDCVRNILQELLNTIKNESLIFVLVGIFLIIIPSLIHYYVRSKEEKNTKAV